MLSTTGFLGRALLDGELQSPGDSVTGTGFPDSKSNPRWQKETLNKQRAAYISHWTFRSTRSLCFNNFKKYLIFPTYTLPKLSVSTSWSTDHLGKPVLIHPLYAVYVRSTLDGGLNDGCGTISRTSLLPLVIS